MKLIVKVAGTLTLCLFIQSAFGQPKATTESVSAFSSETFSGLKLRSIGPAVTSGRVSDFAFNPIIQVSIMLPQHPVAYGRQPIKA